MRPSMVTPVTLPGPLSFKTRGGGGGLRGFAYEDRAQLPPM